MIRARELCNACVEAHLSVVSHWRTRGVGQGREQSPRPCNTEDPERCHRIMGPVETVGCQRGMIRGPGGGGGTKDKPQTVELSLELDHVMWASSLARISGESVLEPCHLEKGGACQPRGCSPAPVHPAGPWLLHLLLLPLPSLFTALSCP